MENLQIGRGWLDHICAAPVFQRLDCAHWQFDFDHGDNWYMEIDRLVMIKRDLFAFAVGVL